eukprot:jgi/Bigna1/145049/aug1.94_g19757
MEISSTTFKYILLALVRASEVVSGGGRGGGGAAGGGGDTEEKGERRDQLEVFADKALKWKALREDQGAAISAGNFSNMVIVQIKASRLDKAQQLILEMEKVKGLQPTKQVLFELAFRHYELGDHETAKLCLEEMHKLAGRVDNKGVSQGFTDLLRTVADSHYLHHTRNFREYNTLITDAAREVVKKKKKKKKKKKRKIGNLLMKRGHDNIDNKNSSHHRDKHDDNGHYFE